MVKYRSDYAMSCNDWNPKYTNRPLFIHNKLFSEKLGYSFICKKCNKKYNKNQETEGYCKQCYNEEN
jgi:hypothetical protein